MSKKNNNTQNRTGAAAAPTTGNSFLNRFSKEELICAGGLIVIFMLVITIRSNFLSIPFERDEGTYSYFGKLTLEGLVPYKDFMEVKFPGLFYFYSIMVWLFGDTVKGMHTGFMYLNLLSILLIYLASRNLFTPVAGLISAATFAFVSLTPNLSGFTVQSEHGVAFFISLGLFFYSLAKKHPKWYFYFIIGFSFGAAVMIKTTAIFICFWGALIIAIDFVFSKPRKIKELIINMGSYSLGGAFIIGLLFLVIYSMGAFSDMVYCAIEAPKKYISSMPYEEGVKYFEYTRDAILLNHKFFWVHAVLCVIVFLVRSVDYRLKFLGITLLAGSFLTITPGYFFYGHYWIQIIPGLALTAGLTCYGVTRFVESRFKSLKFNIRYVYLAVFGILVVNHVTKLKSYYFNPNYDLIMRQVYGNNPFPEAMEIGNYINANSRPEDNIVVIGSEPELYFYTKKKCPSRFAYFSALVNNTEEHKAQQREFVRDVEKAKPRHLIFFNHQLSLLVQPNTDRYIFEWANKYITDNYTMIGCVDMVDGYMRANYAWKEQLATFRPQGQNVIYIYERKDMQAAQPKAM